MNRRRWDRRDRRSFFVVCQPATLFVRDDRGEKPPSGNGGADPLVRGRRPRRPAGALHGADIVGPAAGRGRPARTRGSAPPSGQSASPPSFSWDFAGRRPIQTDHKRRWSVPPKWTVLGLTPPSEDPAPSVKIVLKDAQESGRGRCR